MFALLVLLADPTLLSGPVPADGDYFELPFEVPEGAAELRIQHAAGSDQDILDWGLRAPDGTLRGWGGGNPEDAVVGLSEASRSYLPGLPAGTWSVLVGKALIRSAEPTYSVQIDVSDTPSLAPRERRPYADVDLGGGAGWFAGDLHVHSEESGDAQPTLASIAAYARGRELDFVVLTEHNTTSHLPLIGPVQDAFPDLLLVPGAEVTTYRGHANALGALDPVPFTLGYGVDVGDLGDAVRAGGVLSINHPALDLGDLCIGCAWRAEVPDSVEAVEIGTGAYSQTGALFSEASIAFWDALCDAGHHVAAVGGSDDHRAGDAAGAFYSPIGSPTTRIWAQTLSREALLDGIRAGRTVVQLEGPDDPMIELATDPPAAGDTVTGHTVTAEVTVTGGDGARLRFVVDGAPADTMVVEGDPFVVSWPVPSAAGRVRAEVWVDGAPRTITSHLWLQRPIDPPPGGCGGCAAFLLLLPWGLRRPRRGRPGRSIGGPRGIGARRVAGLGSLMALIAGCVAPEPEVTPLPWRAVTANIGTTPGLDHDGGDDAYGAEEAEVADAVYGNGLSWNPAEQALAAWLADAAPDLLATQEGFWDPWCAELDVDPALDFVCRDWTPERPLQLLRLLGSGWQIACAPGQEDNCLGARTARLRFDGCDDAVCDGALFGLETPGDCGRGARVASAAMRLDGAPLTVTLVHGTSGIGGDDRACRVAQIEQVFTDRGDGRPAIGDGPNLILGDLNTDPQMLSGSDPSAAAWLDHVDGDPFAWLTAELPKSYAEGLFAIDHMASDRFVGDCAVAGLSEGLPAVWDTVYWDHKPVVCDLR